MLKPNWEQHGRGEASVGALTFMLADLHVRTLRLEGKNAEADAYEALRTEHEARMVAPKHSSLWDRIFNPQASER